MGVYDSSRSEIWAGCVELTHLCFMASRPSVWLTHWLERLEQLSWGISLSLLHVIALAFHMVSQHGGQELDFFHGSSGAEGCGGRGVSRVLGRTLTSEGLKLLLVRQVTKASPDSMERTQMGCLSGRSGEVCEPRLISHKFYEKCSSLKEIFERITREECETECKNSPKFFDY